MTKSMILVLVGCVLSLNTIAMDESDTVADLRLTKKPRARDESIPSQVTVLEAPELQARKAEAERLKTSLKNPNFLGAPRGHALYRLGVLEANPERAHSYFKMAIQTDGYRGANLEKTLTSLGWSYMKMGRHESAIPCFQNALKFPPSNTIVRIMSIYHMGTCLSALGRNDAAIAHFDNALTKVSLEVDKGMLLKGKAMAMHQLAQPQAIDVMIQAASLFESNPIYASDRKTCLEMAENWRQGLR